MSDVREELATVLVVGEQAAMLDGRWNDGPERRLAVVDAILAHPDVVLRALGLVSVAGWCTEHACPTIPHDWSEPGDIEFGEECWFAVWNTEVRGCCQSQLGKARIYLDESDQRVSKETES